MSGIMAQPVLSPSDWRSSLSRRQLHSYPATIPRVVYLGITVLATVMLYYELYVGGAVTTLLLPNLNMTFTFYVALVAIGNLIGAFGSFAAGLADRAGRANLVVYGLLITGLYTLFVIPLSTTKWLFALSTFVVGRCWAVWSSRSWAATRFPTSSATVSGRTSTRSAAWSAWSCS
jgi:hypothetical protein